MICFEVRVNGEVACVAGMEAIHFLKALVEWRPHGGIPLRLAVGGMAGPGPITQESTSWEELSWLGRPLVVGDEVSIKIVDLPAASPPDVRHVRHRKPAT